MSCFCIDWCNIVFILYSSLRPVQTLVFLDSRFFPFCHSSYAKYLPILPMRNIFPSSLCTLSSHLPYADYFPIFPMHNIFPSSLCTLSSHISYEQYLPIFLMHIIVPSFLWTISSHLPIFPMHIIFISPCKLPSMSNSFIFLFSFPLSAIFLSGL